MSWECLNDNFLPALCHSHARHQLFCCENFILKKGPRLNCLCLGTGCLLQETAQALDAAIVGVSTGGMRGLAFGHV